MSLPKTYQIILRIAMIFAVIELLIMIAFGYIFIDYSPFIETIIDVSLLTLFATPLVYLTVLKPYITMNKTLMDNIEQQALTDYLTQLANRRSFSEHLRRLVSYSMRHGIYSAILYIDLDKFKAINDTYGHSAGDYVLTITANRLKEALREEDFLCRVGGDEFTVSLPAIENSVPQVIEASKLIAQRILELIKKPIQYEHSILSINASIGLRIVTPTDESVEKILEEVDAAMYVAKQSATDKIYVASSQQSNIP